MSGTLTISKQWVTSNGYGGHFVYRLTCSKEIPELKRGEITIDYAGASVSTIRGIAKHIAVAHNMEIRES